MMIAAAATEVLLQDYTCNDVICNAYEITGKSYHSFWAKQKRENHKKTRCFHPYVNNPKKWLEAIDSCRELSAHVLNCGKTPWKQTNVIAQQGRRGLHPHNRGQHVSELAIWHKRGSC